MSDSYNQESAQMECSRSTSANPTRATIAPANVCHAFRATLAAGIVKWTTAATMNPLVMGIVMCFLVAPGVASRRLLNLFRRYRNPPDKRSRMAVAPRRI